MQQGQNGAPGGCCAWSTNSPGSRQIVIGQVYLLHGMMRFSAQLLGLLVIAKGKKHAYICVCVHAQYLGGEGEKCKDTNKKLKNLQK